MAKASMILGLVSIPAIFLCLGWATSILAIIFGIIGLTAVAKGDGRIRGKGLAWTGIISGVLAIVVYGIFISFIVKEQGNRPATELAAEQALRATEAMIGPGSTSEGEGRGETELERKIAAEFAAAFDIMHGAFIVREDAKEGEDARVKGDFVAVCDITENGCVILARVPEYKRHTDEAKESVAEMAWVAANGALESHADEVPAGTPLVVGLKGLALYGAIMTGEVGGDEATSTSTDRSTLESFYLIEEAGEVEDLEEEAPLE
jgi:hypothetical protein